MFVYVVVLAAGLAIVVHPVVPLELLWSWKLCSLMALSVQERVIEFLVELTNVRFVGAAGAVVGVVDGTTLFEGADAGPVPTAFVAVTVNV